ncbi:MAG: PilZ domain-containing protein [Candidatus Omnitrophica bacterium]|nr:PilZ domain-containing protein [Candidatus Omnitrophota bacterium]MBU1870419.1 PilZ domain-containing protein [Candidatus Omnitrophota bacterium]
MEIKGRQRESVIILDLAGKIDVNSGPFVEAVGQCLRDGYTDILCNFEEVDLVDYMGISVIVIAYKEVVNYHGRMKFVNVPAHVRSALSICGLDKAIEIYADEDMAVNTFKEDKIIEDIKKMQLRRRFKRLPIDIKIELKAKRPRAPECYKLDILDLSAIGAYIYGCDKFKLGDEVLIKMKLPPENEEMELDAKVVWLPDKQVQHQVYPGMGVEFYNISTSAQAKLLKFIERNLSSSLAE